MAFLQLTLAIGSADAAPFEDALFAAGALSVTLQDAADNPVLEPAPGTTPLWPSVRLQALFDAAADPLVVETLLRAELSNDVPGLKFEQLADRVWEREWLKDFRPMRFGKRLWICPDGQRPAASDLSGADAPPCFVDLDPGLAFGTGTHPTTALCLEWLDGASLHGKHVIDYGCGSGILAIAALKLGASSALAVDIDPQAVLATEDNARRNGVAERLHVCTVAQMPSQPADVVLANILAEPLALLAPTLAGLVRQDGHIILSGLLGDQAAQIASRYAAWFDVAPTVVRNEWARVDGVRRNS
jgi:ribosomal protein L11 methyltransferase